MSRALLRPAHFISVSDAPHAVHGRRGLAACLTSLLLLQAGEHALAGAPAIAASAGMLKQLSVEELMNVEVTSVTKEPQKLLQAAASIQVITAEDIRRSGATRIPEALRLADNLEVAQINANTAARAIGRIKIGPPYTLRWFSALPPALRSSRRFRNGSRRTCPGSA